MSTEIASSPCRWLLVLACTLSMTACKTPSTQPSLPPGPPTVPCLQGPLPPIADAPRADEWVEWLPGPGAARLSEATVLWVRGVLGALEAEKAVRRRERACMDALEAQGHIRQ